MGQITFKNDLHCIYSWLAITPSYLATALAGAGITIAIAAIIASPLAIAASGLGVTLASAGMIAVSATNIFRRLATTPSTLAIALASASVTPARPAMAASPLNVITKKMNQS
jgi:FtsH-binding integral membrane protein